ncbi:MAG TPA: hypothetical protein VHV75_00710 [Solirubrobacteraceae bacterium]|nr:hypothetical protein [Solirubrobacteraceae bacterium]
MSFRAARLGLGEWLIGIGSLALLIDLFAVAWFSYKPQYHATAVMLGQRVSANGWQTFDVVGPLTLVVCVAGIAIGLLAATRRSPALPVAITTLLAPVSLALIVVLAIRVLLDQPSVHLLQAGRGNVIEARPGAYVALALSIGIFAGIYLSLRRESVAAEDSPAVIETLSIDGPRTPAAP